MYRKVEGRKRKQNDYAKNLEAYSKNLYKFEDSLICLRRKQRHVVKKTEKKSLIEDEDSSGPSSSSMQSYNIQGAVSDAQQSDSSIETVRDAPHTSIGEDQGRVLLLSDFDSDSLLERTDFNSIKNSTMNPMVKSLGQFQAEFSPINSTYRQKQDKTVEFADIIQTDGKKGHGKSKVAKETPVHIRRKLKNLRKLNKDKISSDEEGELFFDLNPKDIKLRRRKVQKKKQRESLKVWLKKPVEKERHTRYSSKLRPNLLISSDSVDEDFEEKGKVLPDRRSFESGRAAQKESKKQESCDESDEHNKKRPIVKKKVDVRVNSVYEKINTTPCNQMNLVVPSMKTPSKRFLTSSPAMRQSGSLTPHSRRSLLISSIHQNSRFDSIELRSHSIVHCTVNSDEIRPSSSQSIHSNFTGEGRGLKLKLPSPEKDSVYIVNNTPEKIIKNPTNVPGSPGENELEEQWEVEKQIDVMIEDLQNNEGKQSNSTQNEKALPQEGGKLCNPSSEPDIFEMVTKMFPSKETSNRHVFSRARLLPDASSSGVDFDMVTCIMRLSNSR